MIQLDRNVDELLNSSEGCSYEYEVLMMRGKSAIWICDHAHVISFVDFTG